MRASTIFLGTLSLFALVMAFWIHSCSAGPAVREGLRVGELTDPPKVQIGLGRCLREPSVRVAVWGPYEIRGKDGVCASGEELPWAEVRASGKSIRIGESASEDGPIALVPLTDGTLEVEYKTDVRGRAVPASTVRYRGILLAHALADGRIALVNEVDLEDYLKGVVGKEMDLLEHPEALKAQIVTARTYALHEKGLDRLRRVKGERFDLYDDERSQVYGGMERETPLASRLVEETRGLCVVYESRLVRAFYASSCGGHTEPAWEAMADETERMPPLAGRVCEYCLRRPSSQWKAPVVVTKKEISEKCLPPDRRAVPIKSVEISKRLPGGRALELTVTFADSSKVVRLHANNDFRKNVAARFLSLLWDRVEDRGDAIAIYGRGFGHGVGMCQVGAYEMADEGKTATDILEYYFPGVRVQKLY